MIFLSYKFSEFDVYNISRQLVYQEKQSEISNDCAVEDPKDDIKMKETKIIVEAKMGSIRKV